MVELNGGFSNYVWAEGTWFDFQGLARWLAMLQPGGIWMILDASKFQCFKMLVLLPRTLNATIVIRPDGLLPALRGRGPCIWPDSGCLPALRHGGVGAKGEPVANSHGFWFGCDIKQIEKVARLTYCFHFFSQSIYCLSGQIDANYIRHFTWVRHSQRQLCVLRGHYELLLQDIRYSHWIFQQYLHLAGGFKHFLFSIVYGMSSFPLTNSIIFQDGYCTTNQIIIPLLTTIKPLY